MHTTAVLALACYVFGGAIEVTGIVLVIREADAARRALAGLASSSDEDEPIRAIFEARMPQSAYWRVQTDGRALRKLLATRADQRLPVLLLIFGLVLGLAGNLLSLSW